MKTICGFLVLSFLAVAFALDLATVYTQQQLQKIDNSILEDAVLNFTELTAKYGYPSEKHTVTTRDGYKLTLHHIPHGKACPSGKPKTPVLLMHGLFGSSADFIVMGPSNGLGYILADECYDVWLGNSRGNKYSREHTKLSVKNPKFWEFSWHEMGCEDLPAFVDFILEKTGQSSVHYIGHSQGTTQFFIFGALRPEYHAKIRSAHALSPVAIMKNIKNVALQLISTIHKSIHILAELIGLHEFLPSCQFLNKIGMELCRKEYPAIQAMCQNVLFLIAGSRHELLNATMLPVLLGHTPAGAATRQLVHYAQNILTDGFKQYDHGLLGNLVKYGSIAPPEYNVKNISIPIVFYTCSADVLSDDADVDRLADMLPNLVGKYRVPHKYFSHLDYVYGMHVKTLLYDHIIYMLKKF